MRIIVAEDDDINRELVCEILSSEGYDVIPVCDGQELIAKALETKPDLIITDIQMPNIPGDTTIAMIEEYDDLVTVPIIVMTGLSEADYKKLGVSNDIDVLFKPISPEKLIQTVKKYSKK